MIIVHHLEHSRSQRILWLLEELGADYEIKRYRRDPKTSLAPKSLKKIHPLGKSPVISDGKNTIAESATIVEYLARTHGDESWAPAIGEPDYWSFSYWMHYAEGSLMPPPAVLSRVFEKDKTGPMPFFIKPIARAIADRVDAQFIDDQIRTHFGFVDQHLADRDWFLGDSISAVDIQISFPLEAALARGTIGDDYPNVSAYVERFQARDAYLRALDKGGDYDYGPAG